MPISSCRISRVAMSLGEEAVLPEMLARYSGRFAGVCADVVPAASPAARTLAAAACNSRLFIIPPFPARPGPPSDHNRQSYPSEKHRQSQRTRQRAGSRRRRAGRGDVGQRRLQEGRREQMRLVIALEHQLVLPLEKVGVQLGEPDAQSHRIALAAADQAETGYAGAVVLRHRHGLGVVGADLVEDRDRRLGHGRVQLVGDALRAEQIEAAGAVLVDGAALGAQHAGLLPDTDAELAGMIALAEQPIDADLADIEPVTGEHRRVDAGLDAARATAVVDAEIDVE